MKGKRAEARAMHWIMNHDVWARARMRIRDFASQPLLLCPLTSFSVAIVGIGCKSDPASASSLMVSMSNGWRGREHRESDDDPFDLIGSREGEISSNKWKPPMRIKKPREIVRPGGGLKQTYPSNIMSHIP